MRELSSGKQSMDINDQAMWPVGQPIVKLESIFQTSGEAQYVNDIPSFDNELFCAYVLTKYATGKVKSVDASEALV